MALFLGAFAHAEREIERQIIDYLNASGGTPPVIHPARLIEKRTVLGNLEKALKLLKAQDVETEPLSEAERAEHVNGLQYFVGTGAVRLADPSWNPGTIPLLEITGLTPLSYDKATTAWRHPDTPALLARLKRIGVRVFIDPSMEATGAAAFYNPNEKVIQARPSLPYEDLVHEMAHAEFDHYQVAEFIRRALHGENVEALMKQESYSGYGTGRLRKVWELAQRGYPINTINEAMAMTSELIAALELGSLSTSSARHHDRTRYLARHLLNDMTAQAKERALQSEERKWWIASLVARHGSDPDGDLRKLVEAYLWQIRATSPPDYQDLMQMLRTCRQDGLGMFLNMSIPRDARFVEFHTRVKDFVNLVEYNMRARSHPLAAPILHCLYHWRELLTVPLRLVTAGRG